VEEGQATSVEVKLAGYAPVRRVYRFDPSGEPPPLSDRIELVDRVVALTTEPAGAELLRGATSLGTAPALVLVPQGPWVILRARQPGWAPLERSYCNKEGLRPPPLEERLVFAGRTVNLVAPAEAKILVNQAQVGVGSAAVSVAQGTCVRVRVEQPAFLPATRE